MPAREPESGVRRSILRWMMGGFLSLWGLGAAGVGISFFKAPGGEERPSEGRVRCGTLSSLPVGSARFIRHGTEPILVVRSSEETIQAFSAVCTHLRCILQWDDRTKNILCPCHAGAFDRNGNVLSGPPTRPLHEYPAEVRADEIIVRV